MGLLDGLHGADHLLVIEWWFAAGTVPGQQQFHRHVRVHLVPEQMTGKRGNRRVAASFADAHLHQIAPIGERMSSGAIGGKAGLKQPDRQCRNRTVPR